MYACLVADRFVIRASPDGASTCGSSVSATGGTWNNIVANPATHDAAGTLGITESVTHYSCEQPRTGVWYGCGLIDGLVVVNNLFAGMNKDAAHATDRLYELSLFGRIQHAHFRHNTFQIEPTNHGSGYPLYFSLLDPNGSHAPFDIHIADNVLGYTRNWDHYLATNTENLNAVLPNGATVHDFSALNFSLCQPSASTRTAPPSDVFCSSTAGVYSNNIIPGAGLHTGPTMDTWPVNNNSGLLKYPNSNWNDSWSTIPFRNNVDFGMNVYSSYPALNKFLRGGSDGRQVGVDTAQLPLIQNLTITQSDRAAVLNFSVTGPVGGFACVARLSTDSTMSSTAVPIPILPDLDPSLYTRPDTSDADWLPKSGLQRWFLFGRNVALTANTVYYYHLNCGGAVATGSFTTLPTQAGTASISLSRTPRAFMGAVAKCVVEYGSSYSRATGTITGTTISGACSAGSVYSATISGLAKGTPVYVRVRYRDNLETPLAEEPVAIFMPM